MISWARKLVELTEWCEAVFARKTSKTRALRNRWTESLRGEGGNGPATRNVVADNKTDGIIQRRETNSPDEQQGLTKGRGREGRPRDQGRRVAQIGGEVSSRPDVSGADVEGGGAILGHGTPPKEPLDQGELRGRGGESQDRPSQATNFWGILPTRLDIPGDDYFGEAARRQGAQPPMELLGQEELHGFGGDFQDRAMQAGDIDGIVSTRQEVHDSGDDGGMARQQGVQKHMEQPLEDDGNVDGITTSKLRSLTGRRLQDIKRKERRERALNKQMNSAERPETERAMETEASRDGDRACPSYPEA